MQFLEVTSLQAGLLKCEPEDQGGPVQEAGPPAPRVSCRIRLSPGEEAEGQGEGPSCPAAVPPGAEGIELVGRTGKASEQRAGVVVSLPAANLTLELMAASPSSPPAPRPLNASAALTSLLVTGGIGKTASRLLCGLSPWGLGPQCFLRPALRRSCQPPPAGWGWGGTNTQEEADRQRPSLPRAALKRAAAASSAGQPCSLSSGTSAPTAPTHYGHMSGRAPAPRERLGLHLF
ncbi:uncharacterized protein LOC120598548 [Pteropus medius]|uniref:uncharacterized protein LOC120598548 n=1 Tax=Pteropus vampyrus TaxID=132908 RepID=UPI00196BAAD8|nr:uncharacterized protein LOC120598548 [Pteropus giganteus]